MKTAGYSGRPLEKKLGLKTGSTIKLVNHPAHYFDLFNDWPAHINIENNSKILKDFIHFFSKDATALGRDLEDLRKEIKQNGMIWVSWPKKSSGVSTDITEDVVRACAIKHGLVDIKVCAVDKVWSGLKLVIPVKDRNVV